MIIKDLEKLHLAAFGKINMYCGIRLNKSSVKSLLCGRLKELGVASLISFGE
jgi:hypothetical protein